jgi:hypothetical protein
MGSCGVVVERKRRREEKS